jgi:glycine cleavage system H lipoate-binding protein
MSLIIETSCENCVWVNAGVLNYKLCDRDFNCEHCPLDAALRDRTNSSIDDDAALSLTSLEFPDWESISADIQPLLEPLHSLQLCQSARYSANHVWVRHLASGMVRMGMDSFAAALLPDDAQLVTVAHNTVLREGEAFGWVYAWNQTLPLPAPISGIVLCRNRERLDSVEQLRTSPYSDGCLLTVAPSVGTLATARVYSPSAHGKRTQRHCRSILDRVVHEISESDLGICLNDGGAPVDSLPGMFGPDRYWKLVKHFIGGD